MSARRRAVVLGVLALAPLAGAEAAAARPIDPGGTAIAARAELTAGGRAVRVVGRVRCVTCSRLAIAVTVSQRNGALAQGGARCRCTTPAQRWRVEARTRGATRLRAGPARICTWIVADGAQRRPVDAYQWCRDVTLA